MNRWFGRIGLSVMGMALAASAGCARPHIPVQPGKTTAEEMRQRLGEPVVSRTSGFREGVTVHEYEGRRSYQVEDGVVKAFNRDPEPHESTLQYWKHEWMDRARVATEDREIPESLDAHGRARRQLIARSLGLTVEYEPDTGRVRRVVEYAR